MLDCFKKEFSSNVVSPEIYRDTKCDLKEIAYCNLTDVFWNRCVSNIKTIINGLRAELRCKLEKESKTKSEQSTDVMYWRILAYYGHLVFLFPVMRAAEYNDALKFHAATMGQEETEPKTLQTKKEDTFLRQKWI